MWLWILCSWLLIASIIWLVVYGASLYDRRFNTTARHRRDAPLLVLYSKPDELEEALDSLGE